MSAQWFCKISGKEHGPLTAQQLVQLARAHRLKPTDPVRKDKSAWVAASKVQGLFPKVDVAEPVTSTPVSEQTAAWAKPPETEANKTEDSDQGDAFSVLDGSGESPSEGPATQILKELSPGSTLGNYLILETLGEGGMGVVLKAQHIRMDRMVALKVLRSQAMQSPTAVKRFQQEVRAAAKLSHPNIVTAYDADEVRGVHFLVMEYVNGCSLAELLANLRKLEVKDALGYVLQTARGLEYSHGEGVVHRDIKPGNLLLDKRGTVKILDMGLASIKEVTPEAAPKKSVEFVTQENQLLGTFDYMPPEQAEDARSVDHRADIYSLGCTLYRLLTGHPPYHGETAIKKILAHRDSPIPSIREARPDAPIHIDQVFRRMLAKKADARQQSMTEVISELEACIAGKSKPGPVTDSSGGGGLGDSGHFHAEPDSGTGSHSSILRASEGAIYIPSPAMSDSDEDMFALAPEKDERYFWQVMGQSSGPYTRDQLRRKKISPDDLLRLENSDRWIRAEDIPGLM